MAVKVHALDHLVINVSDVARSAEWYRKILGMVNPGLDCFVACAPRNDEREDHPCNCGFARRAVRWQKCPPRTNESGQQGCTGG